MNVNGLFDSMNKNGLFYSKKLEFWLDGSCVYYTVSINHKIYLFVVLLFEPVTRSSRGIDNIWRNELIYNFGCLGVQGDLLASVFFLSLTTQMKLLKTLMWTTSWAPKQWKMQFKLSFLRRIKKLIVNYYISVILRWKSLCRQL